MKTADATQDWARKCAAYVLVLVALFMGLVSLSMPFLNADVKNLWFSLPNFFMLLPMPLLTAGLLVLLWRDLRTHREYRPFFLSLGLFFFELCRSGHQHVALAGSIRNFIPQGSRRSGISIFIADRNRYYAAFSTDLHGLLLLHIQRKSIP